MDLDQPLNHRPSAVLFDMDGTLTAPLLDYAVIKAEMGIGNGPILESLAALDPVAQAAAQAVLHRHEDHAAECSTLNPGCEAVLAWVAQAGLPLAVITRNRRCCANTVFRKHGLKFDLLITREDGAFKPDPAPVLLACQRLGVAPSEAWMIGDGQYDVEAANRAGAKSVWISHGRPRWFEAKPWRTVEGLIELLALLRAS